MKVMPWGKVRKILEQNGVDVSDHGSEKKLVKLMKDGSIQQMRISHLCTRGKNSDVWIPYMSMMQKKFGIKF